MKEAGNRYVASRNLSGPRTTVRLGNLERAVALNRSESLPAPTLRDIRKVVDDYRRSFGRYPNLLRPRRFTEKMQWRKLFDLNPAYTILSDKIAVREFITSRVGAGYLTPLLWTGNAPEDIPFDTLEPPYILKCNHGSGFNILVDGRSALDIEGTCEKLRAWLAVNYAHGLHEPGYLWVQPRLLAEAIMLDADGMPAHEHKMFVFDGKVRMIHTVVVNPARERFDAFHDTAWRPLPWRGINPLLEGELATPRRLDEFVALAERLGADFDHMRVDMYEWNEEPRVGELTLYNWSGLYEYKPDEAELALGEWWQLRHPLRRALATLLSFRRG
jgi:hypothetical protein